MSPNEYDRAPLDPEAPHLPIVGKGYIGLVPWVICSHGDNLRIAIGRPHRRGHVEIDIGSYREFQQLLDFAGTLFAAHQEGEQ